MRSIEELRAYKGSSSFSRLINRLAEASDTSPSTVYRIAQTLMKQLGVPA